jgi:ubiquinone/menaquinone biosynthesis C-methylase UbiE
MQRPNTGTGPEGPTPERILEISWGYCPTHTLTSAVELSLFRHVAEGRNTLAALQAATGASRRGLPMLLDALVALRFLTREGTGEAATYANAPDVDRFLVEGRPGYLGGFLTFSTRHLAQDWSQLTECVRTGRPMRRVENPEEAAAFWGELVDLLFPLNYATARCAAEEIRRLYPAGGVRVLDVAAGSGVWGITVAQADPQARIVPFDLPTTLPNTRRWAEQCGVADRFEFRAGDIRKESLGEGEFDAAILGHICHSEGAEHTRRLLAKTVRALKLGGTVVIADMIPADDRSGPAFPLLFALNMLVHTSEGDTFTFAQYAAWLKEAGFADPRTLEAPGHSPLVLATRR